MLTEERKAQLRALAAQGQPAVTPIAVGSGLTEERKAQLRALAAQSQSQPQGGVPSSLTTLSPTSAPASSTAVTLTQTPRLLNQELRPAAAATLPTAKPSADPYAGQGYIPDAQIPAIAQREAIAGLADKPIVKYGMWPLVEAAGELESQGRAVAMLPVMLSRLATKPNTPARKAVDAALGYLQNPENFAIGKTAAPLTERILANAKRNGPVDEITTNAVKALADLVPLFFTMGAKGLADIPLRMKAMGFVKKGAEVAAPEIAATQLRAGMEAGKAAARVAAGKPLVSLVRQAATQQVKTGATVAAITPVGWGERGRAGVVLPAYGAVDQIVSQMAISRPAQIAFNVYLNSLLSSPDYYNSLKRNGLSMQTFVDVIPNIARDLVFAFNMPGMPESKASAVDKALSKTPGWKYVADDVKKGIREAMIANVEKPAAPQPSAPVAGAKKQVAAERMDAVAKRLFKNGILSLTPEELITLGEDAEFSAAHEDYNNAIAEEAAAAAQPKPSAAVPSGPSGQAAATPGQAVTIKPADESKFKALSDALGLLREARAKGDSKKAAEAGKLLLAASSELKSAGYGEATQDRVIKERYSQNAPQAEQQSPITALKKPRKPRTPGLSPQTKSDLAHFDQHGFMPVGATEVQADHVSAELRKRGLIITITPPLKGGSGWQVSAKKADAGLTPKTQPATDLPRTAEQQPPVTGVQSPLKQADVGTLAVGSPVKVGGKDGYTVTAIGQTDGAGQNVTAVHAKTGETVELRHVTSSGAWVNRVGAIPSPVDVEASKAATKSETNPPVTPVPPSKGAETKVATTPPGKRGRPTKESVLERRVTEATSPDAAKAAQAELDAYRAVKAAKAQKKAAEPAKKVDQREADFRRADELVAKQKRGIQLTEEERNFLDDLGEGEENVAREESQALQRELPPETPAAEPKGGENTVFKKEKLDAGLAILSQRKHVKLRSVGVDREELQALIDVSGYHLERLMREGVYDFGVYTRRMIKEVGDWVEPFLKDLHQWSMEKIQAARKPAEMQAPTYDEKGVLLTEPINNPAGYSKAITDVSRKHGARVSHPSVSVMPDGERSVVFSMEAPDANALINVAAEAGLIGKHSRVTVFREHDGGQNALVELSYEGDPAGVQARLKAAGVDSYALDRDHRSVTIAFDSKEQAHKFVEAEEAASENVAGTISEGTKAVIGDAKGVSREAAAAEYRRLIATKGKGLGVGERTRPAAEPPAPPKVEVVTKPAVRGLQQPKERIRVPSEKSPYYQPWREARPGDVLASDELRIVSDVPGMGKPVETRISPDVSVSPSGIEGHLDDGRPVVLKHGANGWVMTVKGGVPVKVDNLEVRSLGKDRSETAVVTSDGLALTPKEVKAAKEDAQRRAGAKPTAEDVAVAKEAEKVIGPTELHTWNPIRGLAEFIRPWFPAGSQLLEGLPNDITSRFDPKPFFESRGLTPTGGYLKMIADAAGISAKEVWAELRTAYQPTSKPVTNLQEELVKQRLIQAIEAAELLRPELVEEYSRKRGGAISDFARDYSARVAAGKMTQGEMGSRIGKHFYSGGILSTKALIKPLLFAPADWNLLHQIIRDNPTMDWFEKMNVARTLDELCGNPDPSNLVPGHVPGDKALANLRSVFGGEFVNALQKKRPTLQKIRDFLVSAVNVPRTIMASMDMSMVLRQAAVETISHPLVASKALARTLRFAVKPKEFELWFSDVLPHHQYYNQMKRAGLAMTDPASGDLSGREEMFISHALNRIPVIGQLFKASERVYTGYLTKIRTDLFTDQVNQMVRRGELDMANVQPGVETKDGKTVKAIADMVNVFTGRGPIHEGSAVLANALLFAPRLITSRLQAMNPLWYGEMLLRNHTGDLRHPSTVKFDPASVRLARRALGDALTYAATNLALLQLADWAGLTKRGAKPQDPDWGKIKVGNTRIDIWAGYQQYVRFGLGMLSGLRWSAKEGKLIALARTGKYNDPTRGDLAQQFASGKLTPAASFVYNSPLMFNKASDDPRKPFQLNREIAARLVPLIIRDMHDAMRDAGMQGIAGLPVTLAGPAGMIPVPHPSQYQFPPGKAIAKGLLTGAAAFPGYGAQTYDEKRNTGSGKSPFGFRP
jgi:hypothetical protein